MQTMPTALHRANVGCRTRRRHPRAGRRGGLPPNREHPARIRDFHREGSAESAKTLANQLESLSIDEAVRFVHSFTTFLQITNLAEDQIQRRRGRAGDARPK